MKYPVNSSYYQGWPVVVDLFISRLFYFIYFGTTKKQTQDQVPDSSFFGTRTVFRTGTEGSSSK
jgi:hypothetical protein